MNPTKKNVVKYIMIRDNAASVRNLLIAMNKAWINVLSSELAIDQAIIYLRKGERYQHINDIYSCIHLNPVPIEHHFAWSDNGFFSDLLCRFPPSMYTTIMADGVMAFLNDQLIPISSMNYLFNCTTNLLTIPLSIRSWARSVIKNYNPELYMVSVNLEGLDNQTSPLQPDNMDYLIKTAHKEMPNLHFLLLGSSTSWDKYVSINYPNVTDTKLLGYNFIEELALARNTDMYIGSYDKYSISVVGTLKPFMIVNLDSYDMKQITDKGDLIIPQFIDNKPQTLIASTNSISDVYNHLKHFHTSLNGPATFRADTRP